MGDPLLQGVSERGLGFEQTEPKHYWDFFTPDAIKKYNEFNYKVYSRRKFIDEEFNDKNFDDYMKDIYYYNKIAYEDFTEDFKDYLRTSGKLASYLDGNNENITFSENDTEIIKQWIDDYSRSMIGGKRRHTLKSSRSKRRKTVRRRR